MNQLLALLPQLPLMRALSNELNVTVNAKIKTEVLRIETLHWQERQQQQLDWIEHHDWREIERAILQQGNLNEEIFWELVMRWISILPCEHYAFVAPIGEISLEVKSLISLQNRQRYADAASLEQIKRMAISDQQGEVLADTGGHALVMQVQSSEQVLGMIVFIDKLGSAFNNDDWQKIQSWQLKLKHILDRAQLANKVTQSFRACEEMASYLSVQEIADILKNGGMPNRVKKENVAVLFAEFTNFSQTFVRFNAKIQVEMFNYLFNQMHQVINQYHGVVDKIMVPGFMVIWSTSLQNQGDKQALLSGYQCAVALQKKMSEELIPFLANKMVGGISLRIGMNWGKVVRGDIGSSDFRDYTVVGDVINVAHRIMRSGGDHQTVVHENYVHAMADHMLTDQTHWNQCKMIKVKGKDRPMTVHIVNNTGKGHHAN